MTERLAGLVRAELAEPVDPRVTAMAGAIAAVYPRSARAVLFYGSCLRQRELEGLMLDFYLIVSDYRDAYRGLWLKVANTLLPPNVFPFSHDGLAAKYAVLSEADFARLNGPEAGDVSVWARFAQPSRLVWSADEPARETAVAAVARAAPTLLSYAAPMAEGSDPLDAWRAGFALTYASELRAERRERSGSIVDTDRDRYLAIGAAAAPVLPAPRAEAAWKRFRRRGKLLTLLRLAKAATTFAGGADYLAWKINRHAGTRIEVRPWQRRWPILGALILLPRLFLGGAIR